MGFAEKAILYFFAGNNETDNFIVGHLLVPLTLNTYKQVLIDTFWQNGGSVSLTIETVLFANADNDKQREIIIMTRAQAHSARFADNDLQGFYYQSFVFDDPNIQGPQSKLLLLPEISKRFDEEFEGSIYDAKSGKLLKKKTAKYKDPASVRTALNAFGF